MKIHSENIPGTLVTHVFDGSRPVDIPVSENAIVIRERQIDPGSPQVCITISFDGFLNIHYYLDGYFTGLSDLTLFYLAQTQLLFIGGKHQSQTVNTVTGEVKHIFDHALFWHFTHLEDKKYLLDCGELNAVLRDLQGNIIRSTQIEPPWEMEIQEKGVRFHCDGLTDGAFLPFD